MIPHRLRTRPSVRPSCRRSLAFVSRYLKPRSQGLFFPSLPVPEGPGKEFVHPPAVLFFNVLRVFSLFSILVTESLLNRKDDVEIRNTPCSKMAAILLILYSYVS